MEQAFNILCGMFSAKLRSICTRQDEIEQKSVI